jgi:hypothetical protein
MRWPALAPGLVLVVAACQATRERPSADAARLAAADRALAAAIAKAKAAGTTKDACAGLPELSAKLDELHEVAPPAGREQEFGEQRNGLVMKLDVLQRQTCGDPGSTPDMIFDDLDSLRERLTKLEGIGARP